MNKDEKSFMFYPEITDDKFNEKIYLKKEFRDNEIKEKVDWDKIVKKEYSLEPYQVFLKNYISPETPYNGILIFAGVGSGKCHLKGTKIMMFDGSIKNVEDIKVGERLMGDDSTPRDVLSLATGRDKMYDIIYPNGNKYTVNSEHILCLKENDNIVEITVNDYLKLDDNDKKNLKGYKVLVNFPERKLPVDPYFYGYSLIDNTEDNEDETTGIATIYKCNSEQNRLKLLYGIIDASKNDNLEIYCKNNYLKNDIIFLAYSLGYDVSFPSDMVVQLHDQNSLLYHIEVKYFGEDDYYGFTLNYNCRYLLADFTVTHNTCSAISIAEGFKKTLKNMNKKILIISNLKENFKKELFDFAKERSKKNPEDMVQCTGKEYDLGEEGLYLTYDQKRKEVLKIIKSYYEFTGYRKFAIDVIEKTGGWKGDEAGLTEKVKKIIAKEFENRVIIIDEIQNIKTDKKLEYSKSIQPILEAIIKYAKNVKLVLMSATPMFDRPDEIIFYINLLLQNDGRELINKNQIFNSKDGSLKENAEQILRDVFKGYVSYVRGERPFVFPFRIYPKYAEVPKVQYYMSGDKINKNKQLQFTKIVLTEMKNIQGNTYRYYFDKKLKEGKIKSESDEINLMENLENGDTVEKKDIGMLDLIKISNMTYPIADNNEIGSFQKYSLDVDYDNGQGGYYKSIKTIGTRKKIQYKYQSHAIFNKDTINEAPFADEKYLNRYSAKFAKILDIVKNSKGLIFIYSYFITQGVLDLALILEQNGFYRECIEGEDQLLDYSANKLKKGGKRKPICYLCGKDASNIDHHDEKSKNYHIYKIAKYILSFVGSKDIIRIEKDEALRKPLVVLRGPIV